MFFDHRLIARKGQLVSVLERLCQALELTPAQFTLAKTRYEGVGNWLAESDDVRLQQVAIYLQGSTALGTTVKPIRGNEHDIDLVCHMPSLLPSESPMAIKTLIGDRLKASSHYAPLIEEKMRCWRLNYANEFHMDIAPSIPNPSCAAGGEFVPDKQLRCWKETNPKGYQALFERRASLLPRMKMLEALAKDSLRAEVEPFPEPVALKGMLCRTVQLAKRHRDVYFTDPEFAPISVIITTLASRSYEYCVANFVYETEFDVVIDIIRYMPSFIETSDIQGRRQWYIWNETTTGENFAEKWNKDPRLAEAFFRWHAEALGVFQQMMGANGLDQLAESLGASFGETPVNKAIASITEVVGKARERRALSVAPAAGLIIGATASSTPVRANTFFGAD